VKSKREQEVMPVNILYIYIYIYIYIYSICRNIIICVLFKCAFNNPYNSKQIQVTGLLGKNAESSNSDLHVFCRTIPNICLVVLKNATKNQSGETVSS